MSEPFFSPLAVADLEGILEYIERVLHGARDADALLR